MTVRAFVDSNVLLYALTHRDDRKQVLARNLIASIEVVVSTQVLNEVAVNLIRKFGLSPLDAIARIERFDKFECVPLTPEISIDALRLMGGYPISYWDALIVACAARRRCPVLYTEDLSHGSTINGVRIVDPFRTT